jgi:hypothetical protein
VIAASALLVIVAFVTLIVGIFQSGLGMIWVSIGSSVGAAITLLLGVVGSRPKMAVAGGPAVGASPAGTALLDRGEPAPWEAPDAATTAVLEPEPEPEPEPQPVRAAPKRRTSAEVMVVVIPDRDKFHKETCRYARSPAAMTLSKAQARRQGYKQCGVCKA